MHDSDFAQQRERRERKEDSIKYLNHRAGENLLLAVMARLAKLVAVAFAAKELGVLVVDLLVLQRRVAVGAREVLLVKGEGAHTDKLVVFARGANFLLAAVTHRLFAHGGRSAAHKAVRSCRR